MDKLNITRSENSVVCLGIFSMPFLLLFYKYSNQNIEAVASYLSIASSLILSVGLGISIAALFYHPCLKMGGHGLLFVH